MTEAEFIAELPMRREAIVHALRAKHCSPEDAEDFVQDACLKMMKRRSEWAEIKHPMAYLSRAAFNRMKDSLRTFWNQHSRPLVGDIEWPRKVNQNLPEILERPSSWNSHRRRLFRIKGRKTQVISAQLLKEALARNADNRSAAAKELGVSRRSLYNLLHRFGLFVEKE